ncbi:MAG: hypothetical protein KatS3mg130_1062 [Candidatus Sumerlaea sp.]|nr:MAG: hypothetical protein KatS3mg130_1062 [Candidatus Sumerlaea sp.]
MLAEWVTPDRILFGPGAARQVPEIVVGLASRVMVVCGSNPQRHEWLLTALAARGIATMVYSVVGEPSVAVAEEALQRAREYVATAVIGIGGGSALDVAKAVAGLLVNDGELVDYLEVVGKGRPLAKRAAPMIAIPTTAGTGSEATRNAVLEVPEKGVKVSMRSPLLVPTWAVVDPELTLDLPPGPTATRWFRCLSATLGKFCIREGERIHGCPLPGGVAACGTLAADRVLERTRSQRAQRYGVGRAFQRYGTRQRWPWGCSRFGRTSGWDAPCSPWGAVRCIARARCRSKRACSALACSGFTCACAL